MRTPRTAAIAGTAALALACTAGAALAQTSARGRTIEAPPGATVIIIPASAPAPIMAPQGMLDTAIPFPAMPDPDAMFRQVDAMMSRMEREFAMPAWTNPAQTVPAEMRSLPAGSGMTGVVVTSITDGRGTCTQRITYQGNGTAPIVHVSGSSGACAALGTPAASPEFQTPAATPEYRAPAIQPHAARTWEVENHVRPAGQPKPAEVAYLNN